ncbi:unnamed protein product [Rotaria sp. Silwood2]|nr:unnamed protein product [Rotaria sp. Silwood2]
MSSSDNILIELVAELYQRTKQSSTLSYEALLLLRPLPLLLVHIGLLDRLMNKMVHLYIYLIYFHQSYLYDLCDDYFCTWFNKNDLIISLISYNLCKSDMLLGQTTKEYNQLYIYLIERNYKLIKEEIIDSSSIISSSDNILIELVTELYQRTKQSSTLSYEALLLLRPLPLLLVHIGLLDRFMNKIVFEFVSSTQ